MVRAPRSFVDDTRWPEYLELQAALHAYLNEATERIIREEGYRDTDEAAERVGWRQTNIRASLKLSRLRVPQTQTSTPDLIWEKPPSTKGKIERRYNQAPVLIEEAPDDIEPPDSDCSFQVQPGAVLGKQFGGLAAPVTKTVNDRVRDIKV
jgi:hypothetical protein